MKIFLSWSGKQSREIAEAFYNWLPVVIQAVKPWFSPNIEKGAKWFSELDNALEGARFGIVCLTPNNLQSPWLLYEAGALSKTEGARVWTFLHGGLSASDIAPPLGSFQYTVAEKSDVFKLLQSINERLKGESGNGLTDNVLNDVFEYAWPKLDSYLSQVKYDKTEADQSPVRGEREILDEILELVRGYQVQVEDLKYAIMTPSYFSRSQRLGYASSTQEIPFPERGKEVEAILKELEKMNRGLVLTALEDAKDLEFQDRTLTATFANDNVLAKRVRNSCDLFHDIGRHLFGYPIKVRIRIAPGPPLDIPDDPGPPHDEDIPF
jgi:TIR domain-containing protein